MYRWGFAHSTPLVWNFRSRFKRYQMRWDVLTWHEMIWDMMWRDDMRCDVIWDVIRCDEMIWDMMIWDDMICQIQSCCSLTGCVNGRVIYSTPPIKNTHIILFYNTLCFSRYRYDHVCHHLDSITCLYSINIQRTECANEWFLVKFKLSVKI